MFDTIGKTDPSAASTLARLLPIQPPEDLKPIRESNRRSTKGTPPKFARPPGALSPSPTADSIQSGKKQSPSATAMTDLLGGIPMIFDPEVRNKAYDLVKPLVAE
jgi:hypothetical protein